MVSYLGSTYPWHDGRVASGVPSAGGDCPPSPATTGVALTLTGVVCRPDSGPRAAAKGVSLKVPPGQSVALLSRPAGTATDLLDVTAGLRRPNSGQVLVDDIAVHQLHGVELDRFRSSRGLLSMRFPLLKSLSVTENVLAPVRAKRVDPIMADRAAQLLSFVGAAQTAAEPVETLPAERQWRVLMARALMPSPRLVLAEDPARSLDSESAGTILDLLMEAHVFFGFTLVLTIGRVATASCCQRLVTLIDGAVADDVLVRGDDGWTRGRIDRIG
jgi:putative ABC transport system ATP-binding protein